MSHVRCFKMLLMLALVAAAGSVKAGAQEIKTVFVIAMENHNWTQPANQLTGNIQQIFYNPNAPFIYSLANSLVDGTAFALLDGKVISISKQVAYATNYYNVLATPGGNNPISILQSPTTSLLRARTILVCSMTMIRLQRGRRNRTQRSTWSRC